MTKHYRWDTTLDERRRDDPGIDDAARRTAARDARSARDIGYHLAQLRKQRGLTQAEVAFAMHVSQARVSKMEHGDVEKMQVESIAATSPPSAATSASSPTSARPLPPSSTTPTP